MGGLGLMSTRAARRSFTITITATALQKPQSSRLSLCQKQRPGPSHEIKRGSDFCISKGRGTGDKRGDNNVDIPDMYPLVLLPGEDAASAAAAEELL